MKKAIDYLVEILYAGAFLACWAGVAGLLWISVDATVRKDQRLALVDFIYNNIWGAVILYLFAALLFLIGLYFLAQLLQARRHWRRIQHEGPRGPIEISLFAIRSYIERLLAHEFGLTRYRVALEKTSAGLFVLVRAELPVGHNVLDTAERIQRTIEENVEDRIGVKVWQVQVIAAGIVVETAEERPLFEGEAD